mmetsp:Transcript_35993/g.64405  ORF Transcript_35993/g.64405 Transcript_35993/m.64405 type:complete len:245 (+) Transcript_35993:1159-1893(+)
MLQKWGQSYREAFVRLQLPPQQPPSTPSTTAAEVPTVSVSAALISNMHSPNRAGSVRPSRRQAVSAAICRSWLLKLVAVRPHVSGSLRVDHPSSIPRLPYTNADSPLSTRQDSANWPSRSDGVGGAASPVPSRSLKLSACCPVRVPNSPPWGTWPAAALATATTTSRPARSWWMCSMPNAGMLMLVSRPLCSTRRLLLRSTPPGSSGRCCRVGRVLVSPSGGELCPSTSNRNAVRFSPGPWGQR